MKVRLAVGLVTVLAAVLRFSTLDVQSFWGDETIAVHILDGSLGETIEKVRHREITPPLYYVLAWCWTQVFGTGEVGLRSLSALVGTATVPLVYSAGATLVSRRAGLVAAALAAVNPLLVWYSQEARAYALLAFLGAASLLFFAQALRFRSRRALALWAAASGLALATHYFALFLVAIEAISLLVAVSRRAVMVGIAGAAIAGAAVLPIAIPHAQAAYRHAAYHGTGPSLPSRITQAAKRFLIGEAGIGPIGHYTRTAALLVLVGLVLVVIRGNSRERRGAAIALAVAAAAGMIPIVIALAGYDVVNTRNFIALWVPVTIAYAAGFGARRSGAFGVVAAAALFAVFLATTVKHMADERAHRDNWRGVARALGPPTEPRAIVVVPASVRQALAVYRSDLRRLPGSGLIVREVDVVAWITPTAPRPPVGVVASRQTHTFGRITLVRYLLREPRRVTTALGAPFDGSAVLTD